MQSHSTRGPSTLQFLRECNEIFAVVGEGTRLTGSGLGLAHNPGFDQSRPGVAARLARHGHVAQRGDALGERRVSAEQAGEHFARCERLHDHER